ncbi:hypothetical protein ZYGR_0AF04190 [Zygosaccharomyces rouxii]|uniref:Uncharacterized protein n=1 Tax=Zygosaccharomyces rouxii TaxID=4956 RepID=A0A1Q3A8E4_ZYGRO|nr:hypothetical protein ZYGR_0AF04190 [Zygosaccharomyces rouxii]
MTTLLKELENDGYVIEICSGDERCLFRSCTSGFYSAFDAFCSNTTVVNDWRLELKRKAALKYRNASFGVLCSADRDSREQVSIDPNGNLLEGKGVPLTSGAVPIFVKGVPFLVGCLAIDGNMSAKIDHFDRIVKYFLDRYSQEQLNEHEKKLEEEVPKWIQERLKLENPAQTLVGDAWRLFTK